MTIGGLIVQIVTAAHNHEDLPEALLAEIDAVAASSELLQGKEGELQTLLRQLHDYDPYAGVGCFGDGVTLGEIRQTIEGMQRDSSRS